MTRISDSTANGAPQDEELKREGARSDRYPVAHFEGTFCEEERARLRGVLRRAERTGQLPIPLCGVVPAWNVVNLPAQSLLCASRLRTDLIFTGRSARHLAEAVKAWVDQADA